MSIIIIIMHMIIMMFCVNVDYEILLLKKLAASTCPQN